MKLKTLTALAASLIFTLGSIAPAIAETSTKTKYPVILAHGMAGWDSIAGIDYFGEPGIGKTRACSKTDCVKRRLDY